MQKLGAEEGRCESARGPAPKDSVAAAVVQLCAGADVAANLDACERLVRDAAAAGGELIVLPENFPYIGPPEGNVAMAESLEAPGPVLQRMRALARDTGRHLLLGSVPLTAESPGYFYNTAVLLDPTGGVQATYRKIHLFDINIPGRAVFRESQHARRGDTPVTTELLGTTLGLSICYDLRFPELYRALVRAGAELVAVPAAFTLHTGKDHWLALLRARAIENQVYVLAAGQYGQHNPERASFGKSCIIDPWGAIIAQCSDVEGFAVARLDLGYLRRVRRELPCLEHRVL